MPAAPDHETFATRTAPGDARGRAMTASDRAGSRRLLTIGDLRELLRCGRTTAYARVHEDDFPTPVVFSGSAHRWWEHEVIAWIETHRVERRTHPRTQPAVREPQPRPVAIRGRRHAS